MAEDNTLLYSIIAVLTLMLIVWLHVKPDKIVVIYRFHRPTCRYCVQSQPAWEAFKATMKSADPENTIKIKDVNLDYGRESAKLAEKYNVKSVPTVLKVTSDRVEKYDGPRTVEGFYSFATTRR